jgi:beta-lactamase regulating signal transducer with metallopeptidase domain
LTYYHAILVLCFVLPLIQSWQEPIAIVTGLPLRPASASPATSWQLIVSAVLLVGIGAKLSWLAIGLAQLRRYRKRAFPLTRLPDSIRDARRLTGADARFCLSQDVTGPATLGHIDPVVLLPESFQSLDENSQRSIACHELLHVRREDWLVTIIEEIVGALFWFNPGVWWLVAQAKLAREQLVDEQVVKLTEREPYIEALLSMAVVSQRRWPLPAAPFFTQGHLVRRMRLLLSGPRRSMRTLCVCYGSIAAALALASWGVFLWFPLTNTPQVVLVARRPIHDVVVRASNPPDGTPRRVLPPKQFTIAVPPPAALGGDVFYFAQARLPEGGDWLPPPPPPPPPGPIRLAGEGPVPFPAAQGIRMVRRGEVVTSEQIQHLRDALGDHAQIDIEQAEDGTIQRITVQARRLSNEANIIRTPVPAPAAESAAGGDRID